MLKLEPGKKEDYIHCHLEQVSLSEARRKYECVSYVWGDLTELRRIIVDGHWFYVTLNLFHALQHFRDEREERTLWADAICIQQTNPPEKGRQVQLMGQIYENSERTLVWLGADPQGVAIETVDFLKSTSWIARALVDRYGSVTKIPALNRHDNPVSQDPRKWKLFEDFLNFPWFNRVWVLQEVGIAPDVTMHWYGVILQHIAGLG